MNGHHRKHLIDRLPSVPRPLRAALAVGLAALTVIAMGLAWLGDNVRRGPGSKPAVLPATLADSPSWHRVRPGWPKYLPLLTPLGQTADSPSAGAATTAVLHGPPETVVTPPLVVTGPELFGQAMRPVAITPAQPVWQSPPSQFVASQPVAAQPQPPHRPLPLPVPAFVPPPVRMPVAQFVRSEAMEKIAIQSDQQIRHGFELADHGAFFAARAEFTAALRLIAQGLDNDQNTKLHSQALSAALTAMKEAQDFIPAGGKLEGEIDLPTIVASHRTSILKSLPAEQLQAMRALKQYFTFAQAQLAVAAGQEVSGSMALGALGKLHAALAGRPNPEIVAPEAKAIVFFQAAILACPRNYMAANDLGVFLVHSGDLQGARRALEHSVLVYRCAENLNNLSVVYRQVGEQHLAALAGEKAQVAKAAEIARQKNASLSAGGKVQWVDPAALAQSPGQWADPPAKPATNAGQPVLAPAQPVVGLTPSPFGNSATH